MDPPKKRLPPMSTMDLASKTQARRSRAVTSGHVRSVIALVPVEVPASEAGSSFLSPDRPLVPRKPRDRPAPKKLGLNRRAMGSSCGGQSSDSSWPASAAPPASASEPTRPKTRRRRKGAEDRLGPPPTIFAREEGGATRTALPRAEGCCIREPQASRRRTMTQERSGGGQITPTAKPGPVRSF